ncbi:SRPBCC family protein [Nocardia farcinica]|uniref:SRPBCC family protein n=1 Tax=Nocardia farcinica TaxID=37329 RepID=UPI003D7B65AA
MPFSALENLLHRSAEEDTGDPGEVTLTLTATPEEIFDVLCDGWCYGLWVVGASHIRDVDAGWPAAGARIHHGVGPGPRALPATPQGVAVGRARRRGGG